VCEEAVRGREREREGEREKGRTEGVLESECENASVCGWKRVKPTASTKTICECTIERKREKPTQHTHMFSVYTETYLKYISSLYGTHERTNESYDQSPRMYALFMDV